jgi:hypothetical protein
VELLDLGLQVAGPSLKGLAVSTPHGFHVETIRNSRSCTRADGRRGTGQCELGALITYAPSHGQERTECRPRVPAAQRNR